MLIFGRSRQGKAVGFVDNLLSAVVVCFCSSHATDHRFIEQILGYTAPSLALANSQKVINQFGSRVCDVFTDKSGRPERI